jgi:hypothetical protein
MQVVNDPVVWIASQRQRDIRCHSEPSITVMQNLMDVRHCKRTQDTTCGSEPRVFWYSYPSQADHGRQKCEQPEAYKGAGNRSADHCDTPLLAVGFNMFTEEQVT